MEVASAIAASTTLRTCRVASTMRAMPDNADSAVCSASCTQRCTIDKPNGNTAHRITGDADHGRDSERLRPNVELGATDD